MQFVYEQKSSKEQKCNITRLKLLPFNMDTYMQGAAEKDEDFMIKGQTSSTVTRDP